MKERRQAPEPQAQPRGTGNDDGTEPRNPSWNQEQTGNRDGTESLSRQKKEEKSSPRNPVELRTPFSSRAVWEKKLYLYHQMARYVKPCIQVHPVEIHPIKNKKNMNKSPKTAQAREFSHIWAPDPQNLCHPCLLPCGMEAELLLLLELALLHLSSCSIF